MTTPVSLVLAFPPAPPQETCDFMHAKLSFHADAWDVAADLRSGVADIVVIDTRSEAQYARGHIPGAVSFPHPLMDADHTAGLDRRKTYVTYCDGIGCNGSTKGAYKLAKLGFSVKEMLGGLDFWLRDGHPVATGSAPGAMPTDAALIDCAC